MSQPEIYGKLLSLYSEGRLPSSLLFAGRKGVGKWNVATDLAKAITCQSSQAGFCGNCSSCRQADSFSHPDIFYLFPLPQDEKKSREAHLPYLLRKQQHSFSDGSDDVKSFITIDSIRKFQNSLALRPSLSNHKVGIIYEAERMLPATMDSLLKTLEEPPSDSYLIVVTDQPRFLLPTIMSRLRRINLPVLTNDFVNAYITSLFKVENQQAGVLGRFAGGSLHNVESLVEKNFFEAREAAFDLFSTALTSSLSDLVVKYAESPLFDTRERVEGLVTHWQSFLRDLLIMDALSDKSDLDIEERLVNFDLLGQYRNQQSVLGGITQFEKRIERLEQVKIEIRRNVNPKMAAYSFLSTLRIPDGTPVLK